MELNLWHIFSAVCASVADREAIVAAHRRFSYAQLADRSSRLAQVLSAHGLGVHTPRAELSGWEIGQDTVALCLLNSPEYLECSLGGYAARTAPFNVNYRYVPEELAYVLNDAGASAVVYHARFAPAIAATLPQLRRTPLLLQVADESGNALLSGALDYETSLTDAPALVPRTDQSPDDIYLLYTGGTTGMPKGTLWRQSDIWHALLSRERYALDDGADVIAAAAPGHNHRLAPCAPLMHGAGHCASLGALLSGGTVVFNDIVDRVDPTDFWRTVERERVTRTVFIGEAVARPLLAEVQSGRYDTSALDTIVNAGAPMTPETKQRLTAAIPQLSIADTAGSSETGRSLQQNSTTEDGVRHGGLFTPLPGAGVLDADRTRVLEPGHQGVGWFAKSGRLPLGYLGDRTKTEQTFFEAEGVRWVVPGDRAQLTSDGLVRLLGRDSATINSGGEKIFSEEVEAALMTHQDVADAIVIGRPSEQWGQEVVALVELAPGSAVSDHDLLVAAGERIARYKLPKAVIRVPSMGRTTSGKPDYPWAARQVTAHGEGRPIPAE
ncbi:AMP-binding protein [Streptomyces albipurpureus]|uniref:AMP-binding protein n=1 Tax=Streptomyces albipurpureus TaxID=2897419 RepID=A0ABT0UHQ3_9ACTN|nr:AMP-binding protein [Streptomyces sp. CWNU-1]MCM2387564.1 AMP-binding protein [Streptomyces sp. CWNU-1]